MRERAAAALALGQHDVNASAVEHPDRGGVDLRRQHALRASRQHRDAAARPANGDLVKLVTKDGQTEMTSH